MNPIEEGFNAARKGLSKVESLWYDEAYFSELKPDDYPVEYKEWLMGWNYYHEKKRLKAMLDAEKVTQAHETNKTIADHKGDLAKGEYDEKAFRQLKLDLKLCESDSSRTEKEILMLQISTLNNAYNKLLSMSFVSMRKMGVMKNAEKLMRLALKAQAQCKSNISLLNNIKNPNKTIITKYANVADKQQINNTQNVNLEKNKNKKEKNTERTIQHRGESVNSTPTIAVIPKETIEHAKMDTTSKTEAKRANNEGEALVKVNRGKD